MTRHADDPKSGTRRAEFDLYHELDARSDAIARVVGQMTYWLEDCPEAGPDELRAALARMRHTLRAGLVHGPRPPDVNTATLCNGPT